MKLKALAFNSSPRMEKGNTALILNPFLDGLRGAGTEAELHYNCRLDLKPCRGCFDCWLKTPGVCSQKDDMRWLIPKMRDADILVFATPLYSYGMTAHMKNMIDRMIALADPFMEVVDGCSRHIVQEGAKEQMVVLVSNCGLWGLENFNALVVHMKMLGKDPPMRYAGALLRPHGEALRAMLDMGAAVNDIIEAAMEAGRQLATKGEMSQETLDVIGRDLLPQQVYVDMANEQFRSVMEKRKARG